MHSSCGGASSNWIVLQVALERSKGNLSGAIELLRKYLDVYMLDRVAWEELGELYLQVRAVLSHQDALVFVNTAASCAAHSSALRKCLVLHYSRTK